MRSASVRISTKSREGRTKLSWKSLERSPSTSSKEISQHKQLFLRIVTPSICSQDKAKCEFQFLGDEQNERDSISTRKRSRTDIHTCMSYDCILVFSQWWFDILYIFYSEDFTRRTWPRAHHKPLNGTLDCNQSKFQHYKQCIETFLVQSYS